MSNVRHMNNSDLVGISTWGVIVGGFAFLVLNHNLKQPLRAKAIRWCLAAGGCAVLYFASFLFFKENPLPTKGTLGLGFVGFPALVCGLLLFARDFVQQVRRQRNA